MDPIPYGQRQIEGYPRTSKKQRRTTYSKRPRTRNSQLNMLRLQDNPPMKFPPEGKLNTALGDWTAAYCKPRQEKALAHDLCRLKVPYFLPMIYRETSSGGRRRRNLYPMFKSYLFFAGGEDKRLAVTKTNRLVNLVEISAANQETFRREISSLELALREAPEQIELYPQLAVGKRVLVTGGPMKGAEGIILDAKNPTRLWIGVTIMGSGASVEIHADLVDPQIDDSSGPEPGDGKIEYRIGAGQTVDLSRNGALARDPEACV